jgi:hypothetical protein
MSTRVLLAEAYVMAAFLVVCGVLGFYGLVYWVAQCVRHCKKIWRKHE